MVCPSGLFLGLLNRRLAHDSMMSRQPWFAVQVATTILGAVVGTAALCLSVPAIGVFRCSATSESKRPRKHLHEA